MPDRGGCKSCNPRAGTSQGANVSRQVITPLIYGVAAVQHFQLRQIAEQTSLSINNEPKKLLSSTPPLTHLIANYHDNHDDEDPLRHVPLSSLYLPHTGIICLWIDYETSGSLYYYRDSSEFLLQL